MQVSIDVSWDCPEESPHRAGVVTRRRGGRARGGVSFRGYADPPDVRHDSIDGLGTLAAIALGRWRSANWRSWLN